MEEKVKIFACANYSKELCYDDKAVHEHIINNVDSSIKWVFWIFFYNSNYYVYVFVSYFYIQVKSIKKTTFIT